MPGIVLGPDYDLARRLDSIEAQLRAVRVNPVLNDSAVTSQTTFAVLSSVATFGSKSVTVPDGYSTCLVFSGVSGGSFNSSTAGYLYVAAVVNGIVGAETPVYVPGGQYGSGSAFTVQTLTGLAAGDTITVGTQMRTSTASWASSSSSVANTNALFFYFR